MHRVRSHIYLLKEIRGNEVVENERGNRSKWTVKVNIQAFRVYFKNII